jgi:crotonobetainyl-CoA:carnitine CoA-transferase CaiB-like acyl-CoA transferase
MNIVCEFPLLTADEEALAEHGGGDMLSLYRVLDLTDEGALICGQVLGDLGADVILVDRPEA